MDQPPSAAANALPVSAAAPIKPLKVKPPCTVHPAVTSTQVCEGCRKPICAVCDFSFTGNAHLCPTCAAAPPPKVSGNRTTLAIIGLVLCVVSMALWGAFAAGTLGQFDEHTAGLVFAWAIMLPGIAAYGMSMSAIDRRLGNNLLVWISAGLSSVFVIVLLALILIGNFSQ